ncbi:unnamed protein product [Psylliodes chrysocephalus]|uniref:DUF7869 domain-containing protein n=1 Tax=Psylliodes chrysocephalus TaxID=3402493 RepID=A0A9P0CPE4_9CUCU|nr:unnamed protein product [Psylliodes chrysocephala]
MACAFTSVKKLMNLSPEGHNTLEYAIMYQCHNRFLSSVFKEKHGFRSRKRKKKTTKREAAKQLRYLDHFPNLETFERPCMHNGPTYKCFKITRRDITVARKKILEIPDKHVQDRKLSYLCKVFEPKRYREKYRANCRNQKHVLSAKYNMVRENGKTYRVCQKMILKCFGITLKRLHTITRNIRFGSDIKERRGGYRRSKKNDEKREEVKKFLGKLRARESHYNRQKSKRLYLPAHFNIKKLWKLYNASVAESYRVKYGVFNKIFSVNFNIGFGSPASDVCSFCFKKKNELKNCTDELQKVNLMTELRIHKLRSKQFHVLINKNEENNGCAGQNKNSYVMYALALWLSKSAPVILEEIRVTFPVRGHSFLPADRVFGRLEKKFRQIEVILNAEEYIEIYKEVGTVKELGTDWTIKDFKALDASLKKLRSIKDTKRIILRKDSKGVVKIKMELYYRNDDLTKSLEILTKKGKVLKELNVKEKELKNPVKEEKIKNLKTLLSLFDENWQQEEKLYFFKELLLDEPLPDSSANQDDEPCDCNEDDGGVFI